MLFFVICALILIFPIGLILAALIMTEGQLSEEGRMADRYGGEP